MPLKLMTVVGTRPEIIKLSRVIPKLDKHFSHTLVHTGQNYDYQLNEVFFKDLEIRKPDFFMEAAKETASQTIAEVIKKTEELILKVKPDAILLYGDTNSCLCALSAKRYQIPIFHMEAGNRCFDQRVPEEINRKIIDHISDINMVHSEHSRRYLISEGLPPEQVIKTGSPMKEVIAYFRKKITSCDVLSRLNLTSREFFLVSIHREENVDYKENIESLIESLNKLATHYKKKVIVSTHPRTRKRIDSLEDVKFNDLISFMEPMGYFDYCKLQTEALCVVSDSGTITEESSMLKFPAVTVRQAHERPEGMDHGVLVMSGLDPDSIIDSVDIAVEQSKEYEIEDVTDYQSARTGYQVVKVIQSYTGYVNRVVWRKSETQKIY